MKKIIYLGVFVVSALLMISCEKDEIGGTATENVAGEWKVTATEVDANRKEVKRLSNILIATYNSAANSATEIWVDNNNKLLKFKVKAKADMNTLTFSVANGANAYGGEQTTLKDGEILMVQATTPSGMPADSIICYVSFSDNPGKEYKLSGYRRTGFAADE